MTEQAVDIYQTHLDVSTRFVFKGDATGYLDHVQLPFVFRTAQGAEVVETAADMAGDIARIHASLTALRTTDYHRIARSARYLDDSTIEGFHVTYALHNAVPVLEPYESRMILRHAGGVWKASFAEHELSNPILSHRSAQAMHGVFSSRWNTPPSHGRRSQLEALPLYRSVVKKIAEHASGTDADAWYACYTQPYTVHYDEGDGVIETADQSRRFHTLLHEAMDNCGADTLTVKPTSAIFLSDDRLLGYHNATLTRNEETLFGPVQSRMILVEENGNWLCNSVSNALSTSALAEGTLVRSDTFPTMREIQKRTKT
jgi:hypothetical protein